MKPTSDERREVAARLREYPLESVKADHKGEDPLQLPADVMYDIMDIAGVGEDFDSLLPSLADLIDPTCHDFGGEEGTNGEGYDFACSACGYVCDLAEPEFCPNCGARVVSGDDQ